MELDAVTVTFTMKAGEGDMLFGSVTSSHIAEELEKLGLKIDKRKIEPEEPIKRLGEYQVPVRLHKNIIASVKVSVVRE
jgi:large subunit ribosomal protein L9